MIWKNWEVTIQDYSTVLKLIIRTVHKHCSQWTRILQCVCPLCTKMSQESKNRCFEIALSHLQWFKEDRNEFLESTVTGDRTPVEHLTHETKQAGMEWEQAASLTTAWGNLQHQAWTSVMRSDPLVWKCNPTQHTSDTWVSVVISLGTSCYLHPINRPGLARANCYLFGLMKQYLGGHQFHSYAGVEMAVCELL